MIPKETYTYSLFERVSDRDQRHMTPDFKKEFDTEADEGGFTRGKRSFFVSSENADMDCLYAFACLVRGGYPVMYLDPVTIIRRLDSKWIPRWTEEDDNIMNEAEVIIIPGLLDDDIAGDMTPSQKGDLVWFVKDAIRNGVVIVAPTEVEASTDVYGDSFDKFIEQNFEVVSYAAQEPTGKQSQHNRHEIAGKHRKKGKRKNTTGD